MVVSGLPVRNDIQHAGEIASMALQVSPLLKQSNILGNLIYHHNILGAGKCEAVPHQAPARRLIAPENRSAANISQSNPIQYISTPGIVVSVCEAFDQSQNPGARMAPKRVCLGQIGPLAATKRLNIKSTLSV